MENYIVLIVATVAFVSFVVMELIGRKYNSYVQAAPEKGFPMSELYTVGFAWQQILPKLSYGGSLSEKIKEPVKLLYGEQFCEYYCRLILAQAYTFAHLAITFCCILACFVDQSSAPMVILLGVVAVAVLIKNYIDEPQKQLKARADACVEEFPTMVMKLSLMISSGMILREAWFTATKSTSGQLHELMDLSCTRMANGMSDIEAIRKFGYESNSKEMKRFATELVQGIEKGSSELVSILVQQSDELWELKKQMMLQKGEKASAKLLIPTALMFAGLLLVVITAAMAGQGI